MPRLIFFCGHAGTGKTTLAHRLIGPLMRATGDPFCLLDKDTLYGRYSAAAMAALTGDPNDRDSPTYLAHLRDPEYEGLLDTARENLSLGISVIVVGPLSREVRAHQLDDPAWLRAPAGTDTRVVWVHLPEDEAHARIVRRANPNDAYKLAHWETYRTRRFLPPPADYPELIYFDNSAPGPAEFDALLATLAA
ncbi:ATPase [Cupriavidus sp. USMAA2-4]|uniref:ATPase n=1 Tax=Cupriavidus malaysiensis TaxID=367825 RepID=A0ABN4TRL8_9BURK|nr:MULTISPECIES: ATP-binding protein [Cupriavidus]AOY93205.1 ATPase [Cupriavidus sp. USMAA2-4]AOZ00504.1 ATPase [Cupriavidus sp. USMAHM13]AOZ07251.1 ATPase [Cupriavidus malaysiensis]